MSPRIVTVTPNPSIDHTVEVAAFRAGDVHAAAAGRQDAGGKGVNIARVLDAHDVITTAVMPLGGSPGGQMRDMLIAAGVPTAVVWVEVPTRSNITLVEDSGRVTKFNSPGGPLDEWVRVELLGSALSVSEPGGWMVGSGSLPPGLPTKFYAQLVTVAHRCGNQAAIDTTGDALLAAVDAGADLIKPNRHELAAVVRHSMQTIGDVVEAAESLRRRGAGAVLVSLGAAGAVYVGDRVIRAVSEPVVVRSDIGAGDCMLAGWLAEPGSEVDRVRRAVAWGAAAVRCPGTAVPGPLETAAIHVDVLPFEPAELLAPDHHLTTTEPIR